VLMALVTTMATAPALHFLMPDSARAEKPENIRRLEPAVT